MYTVSKAPIRINCKTRRGISQNYERLENLRDSKKKDLEEGEISPPKPVFHPVNGKKSHSFWAQQEVITPQHEEIIKFVHDSWISVRKECEEGTSDKQKSSVVYFEAEPNPKLKDFKPFDLESWWGKRLFNTITKSVP